MWQRDGLEIFYMRAEHNRLLTVGRLTGPGNQYPANGLVYICLELRPTKRVVVPMSVASP
jgi:hypothetical protein